MAQSNTPREANTRDKGVRPQNWKPQSGLPDPHPQPGFTFRWVRISSRGELDPSNVNDSYSRSWTPVLATEHPEIKVFYNPTAEFKDNIVIGGLMLCKAPVERIDAEQKYSYEKAKRQIEGVNSLTTSADSAFAREANDPRMPKFNASSTRQTFGTGF